MKKTVILFLLLGAGLNTAKAADLFEIEPSSAGVGRYFEVRAKEEDQGTDTAQFHFNGGVYTLFRDNDTGFMRNFIGVSLKTAPGKYSVAYKTGEKYIYIYEIAYPSETILLPEPAMLNAKTLNKESGIIAGALNISTHLKHWKDRFLCPVKYTRISSTFGRKRVYNTGSLAWQHKGIDFVAAPGTRVVAANAGIVKISRKFRIHGNTVIIDHGQGIFSIYNHLAKRKVKEGKKVRRKELIGTVGATGAVTGAHLHFGVSVSGTRVDPSQWID